MKQTSLRSQLMVEMIIITVLCLAYWKVWQDKKMLADSLTLITFAVLLEGIQFWVDNTTRNKISFVSGLSFYSVATLLFVTGIPFKH